MSKPRPSLLRALPFTCALILASACTSTPGPAPSASAQATPLERARNMMDTGRMEEAVSLLSRAHRDAPDDLDIARAFTEAQVRSGATEAFLQSLASRPPSPVVHYMRGLALFTRPADASGPAIDAFRTATEGAPERAELHYRLGVALLETEQVEEALPPLQRALELEPTNARFRLPLAKALALTGDREGAVAQLALLVRSEPAPTTADIQVGRQLMLIVADPYSGIPASVRPRIDQGLAALHERDQPQPAIVAFEEILRDFPDLAVVHSLVGLAWLRLDDAGRALDRFRKATELAPWDGHNHLYLGNLYASRQRPDQALEAWRRAVELHPLLGDAWSQIGATLFEQGDLDGAAEALRITTVLEPGDPVAFGRLAMAHQLAGRLGPAEDALARAIRLAPSDAGLHLSMGALLAERAQASTGATRSSFRTRAREAYQKVLELQPDNLVAAGALERLSAAP
ncbi:MAG TPA: tetratricopeptide repeat protein [Myxococcaceae bacterium]|nr:tetratricopeptide repeat protein [Myxococcaceae bacterium]